MNSHETHLVRVTLSQLLGRQAGERWVTRPLNVVLGALSSPRVAPTGERGGWPDGRAALRRLGIDVRQLDAVYIDARERGEPMADSVLDAFVNESLWPTLLKIIAGGPVVSLARLEPTLRAWAAGREGGAERQTGALSSGSIDALVKVLSTLAITLDNIRRHAYEFGIHPSVATHLDQWRDTELPRWPSGEELGAIPANRDRAAPPLRLVRLILRGINWELEQRRQSVRGAKYVLLLLHARALLGLACLGLRRAVLQQITPADIFPTHEFPDGSTGSAIRIRPGKTLRARQVRFKALPIELYEWLCEYIACASLGQDERLFKDARRVAAILRCPVRKTRVDLNPYFKAARALAGDRVYSAHTLRHLAHQLACLAGQTLLSSHYDEVSRPTDPTRGIRINGQGFPTSPEYFAGALLDHSLRSLSGRYGDLNTEKAREQWTSVVVPLIWDQVAGDGGAPRQPDSAATEAALLDLKRSQNAEGALRAEIDAIERRLTESTVSELSGESLILAVFEQQRAATRLTSLARQLAATAQRTAELNEKHSKTKTTLVPVDDLHSAIEEGYVEPRDEDETPCPILRNYAWPEEFRWAVGTNALPASTLRRWLAGTLPFTPGDRRRLFEDADIEVISPRLRRIRLENLDWSRLTVEIQERLEVIRRTPDPRARRATGD